MQKSHSRLFSSSSLRSLSCSRHHERLRCGGAERIASMIDLSCEERTASGRVEKLYSLLANSFAVLTSSSLPEKFASSPMVNRNAPYVFLPPTTTGCAQYTVE